MSQSAEKLPEGFTAPTAPTAPTQALLQNSVWHTLILHEGGCLEKEGTRKDRKEGWREEEAAEGGMERGVRRGGGRRGRRRDHRALHRSESLQQCDEAHQPQQAEGNQVLLREQTSAPPPPSSPTPNHSPAPPSRTKTASFPPQWGVGVITAAAAA